MLWQKRRCKYFINLNEVTQKDKLQKFLSKETLLMFYLKIISSRGKVAYVTREYYRFLVVK